MSDDKSSIEIVADAGRGHSPWKLPARWKLEVRGKAVRFKAAIARDGILELIESVVPYDKEFTASRLIALFESMDESEISVVAYSDASGMYTRQCSFGGGRSGRILFDGNIPAFQAGSL